MLIPYADCPYADCIDAIASSTRLTTNSPVSRILRAVSFIGPLSRSSMLTMTIGGRAMPLNFRTTNVLFGEKISLRDDAGGDIDLGHVGRVTRVDRTTIENLCYAGQVPVIPSMCLAADGGKLNVNADTSATAVATALGAEKLIFLSDVNGARMKKDDPKTLIHSLTATQARQLISDGAIESGMIPKVEGCVETLDKGVRKIHIIDGRLRHSLLLEIYTNKGVGTEMLRDD